MPRMVDQEDKNKNNHTWGFNMIWLIMSISIDKRE